MDPASVRATYQAILRFAAKELFKLAWCRETARVDMQSVWDAKTPSRGQCDATALVIEGICGGDILVSAVAGYGSHYYNRLPDGTEIDLTAEQFPAMVGIPKGTPIKRERLLKSRDRSLAEIEDRTTLLNELFYEALDKVRTRLDNLDPVLTP